MANIGYATVRVIPVSRGIQGALQGQLAGPLAAAGRSAGRGAGAAMAQGLASQASLVAAASDRIARLRGKEADAAGKVRIAEERLREVRASETAKSSQVVAAEERLSTARRNLSTASVAATRASRDNATAMSQANTSAQEHGRVLGGLAGTAQQAGTQMVGFAKSLSGIGSATAAVAGLSKIVTIGNDFTRSLNTMGAVSAATDSQLAAVSQRAKELGNDISLPGVSASDAAAAMTELAKGGFSVEQSMQAAKGTLQLAGAAQIDAAQAATIQSQALQAFGKDATYASTAADVLANTANASSAEITDVASGLQASGAVAHQFGLTMEDTATALALFANSGIKGSDAGTLLKSALLALTDQGKPAQAAIEDLGLKVYDAQGKFVGLESLFGQLQDASKRMTPEMYQAATATLFGSDAARLAGVAAEQGAAGFDKVHAAITKQGTAAEVAAAKTKGLPGAMASVQNSAETLALGIYQLIDGPLESFANSAASGIGGATPILVGGLQAVGSAVGVVAKVFGQVPGPVLAAAAALAALKVTGLGAGFASAASAAGRFASQVSSIATASGGIASAGQAGTVALGRFGSAVSAIGQRVPVVTRMQDAFITAAAGADRFGRLAGTGSAAMTGLASAGRAAASGVGALTSALGGPVLIGIAAAGVAISEYVTTARQASKQEEINSSSATKLATAQRDLAKAFQASNGAVSAQVLGAVTAQVDATRTKMEQLGNTGRSTMNKIFTGPWETDADKAASTAEGVKSRFDSLGLTSEELAGKISGTGAAFNATKSALNDGSDAGGRAADELQRMRDSFVNTQQSAALLTPGVIDLEGAFATLADKSASADQKLAALKVTMDVLSGKQISMSEAVASFDKTLLDVERSATGAADQTKGFGDALVGANGAVNTQTENGQALYNSLTQLRDGSVQVAQAAYDQAIAQGQSVPQAQQAANDAMSRGHQALMTLGAQYGLSTAQIDQMARSMGLVPDHIVTDLSLNGADTTLQQMTQVQQQLSALPPGQTITINAPTDEARANLLALGFKVEEVAGKPGIVKVSAPNATALAALQAVIDKVIQTGAQSATPKINVDTTQFRIGAEQAQGILAGIDRSQANPQVNAILDKLKEGKAVTLADLQQLSASTADPNVILQIAKAIQDAQVVSNAIDNAAKDRKSTITVEYAYPNQNAAAAAGVEYHRPRADGGIDEYATGGIRGMIKPLPSQAIIQRGNGPGLVNWAEGETGDEAFIPLAESKRTRSTAILGETAKRMGMVVIPQNAIQKFADGGIAGKRALDVAKSHAGEPYVYGGRDCSQFQSEIASALLGRTVDFTTDSDFGALGFQPGYDPGGYNIGTNGGVGENGHMAGDLLGTHLESASGKGVTVGGNALGAQDFPQVWHLPRESWSPPPAADAKQDAPKGPPPALTEEDRVADAIIAEGRKRGISEKGIKIALATGLAESGLRNLNYGDRDSTGVFQQRDNGAWGTAEDRMDPTRAAGMFYDQLSKQDYNNMDPAAAAQAVQKSEFSNGSNYAEQMDKANQIYDQRAITVQGGDGASQPSLAEAANSQGQPVYVTNWPTGLGTALSGAGTGATPSLDAGTSGSTSYNAAPSTSADLSAAATGTQPDLGLPGLINPRLNPQHDQTWSGAAGADGAQPAEMPKLQSPFGGGDIIGPPKTPEEFAQRNADWAQKAGQDVQGFFANNWKEMLNTVVGVGLGSIGQRGGDTYNVSGDPRTVATAIARQQARKTRALQLSGGFPVR